MDLNYIDMMVLIVVLLILSTVLQINSRVKGLKYTLDQLTKHENIPEYPINDELRKLISNGEDVKAVKKVRETLGLSLLEGKQYIDALKLESN